MDDPKPKDPIDKVTLRQRPPLVPAGGTAPVCLCVLLEDASRRVLEVAVLPTGHVVDLTAVLVRAVRDLCLPAVLHQDNGTTHPGGRRRAALRQVRSHDSDARGRTGGACGSLRRSDAEVLGSLGSTPRPSEGNP